MADLGMVVSARRREAATYGRPMGAYVAAWLFWIVIAGNTAGITYLWYQGGNVTAVHDAGELWTSLGRLTGFLSAFSALLQVLLLARLPFIERATGFDRLTVWHRRNGKICLYLVLAHVVFITIGYAMMDRLSIPNEISSLLTNYPGMIAATFGTGLFIVVTISSLVIARRRLPYQLWFTVHITAYAAIALAWFHQIPTGNELVLDSTAANYWTSLYIVTLALLVIFRILQPIAQAFWYQLQIEEVIREGPTVVSLRITGRRLERLRALPGQFFLWRFLTWNCFWESHPFSLSAAPDGQSLRISVKNMGNFSGRVGELRPGTRIVAEGPFGTFTQAARRRNGVALIAGGIGITPIRALLEEMDGDVVLIYRVMLDEDIVFRNELDRLSQERTFRVLYVVGDHRAPGGERLMSPEHLRELVPDLVDRDVYVCGPPGMMRFIETNVRRAGVPRRAIHSEAFAL